MAAVMHYGYISDQYYGLRVCILYPDFKLAQQLFAHLFCVQTAVLSDICGLDQ